MMRRLRKFLHLSWTDRILLVKSAFLLVAVRLGLWLLPFQTLRRLLGRVTRLSPGSTQADQTSVDRVVWAVSVAGRHVPRAGTCLTQALTAQTLLARRGHPARLRIGVTRDEDGQLQAHAWVESRGRIVIGGAEDLSRFAPLSPLEPEEP